jgi:imidazole glycerol phosphate synthase glutamine amidotransferase subunit
VFDGNLSSVVNVCRLFGFEPIITSKWQDMDSSDLIILPGQGAYQTAMDSLKATGAVEFIKEYVRSNRPFLGICVGFQLLFEGSYENGFSEGLGLFSGVFKEFQSETLKVPHMGWNTLEIRNEGLYDQFNNDYVYFVHSYFLDQTCDDLTLFSTDYSQTFVSSIARSNLLATQFHPEKSGDVGIKLLETFFNSVKE